ncbi:MAG: hypothetical protein R3C11_29015 [Planctomycetaceae bacterium]
MHFTVMPVPQSVGHVQIAARRLGEWMNALRHVELVPIRVNPWHPDAASLPEVVCASGCRRLHYKKYNNTKRQAEKRKEEETNTGNSLTDF